MSFDNYLFVNFWESMKNWESSTESSNSSEKQIRINLTLYKDMTDIL